jgi:hypothetical protein
VLIAFLPNCPGCRQNRIGARDNVLLQHLVLAGSLDAVLVRTLLAKQKVLDGILLEEMA